MDGRKQKRDLLVVFYMQMGEDRSAWELSDWAYTVFSAALCLGATAPQIADEIPGRRHKHAANHPVPRPF